MEVAIKKLTAFRLDSNLLDMLKSAAKREHRVRAVMGEIMSRPAVTVYPINLMPMGMPITKRENGIRLRQKNWDNPLSRQMV